MTTSKRATPAELALLYRSLAALTDEQVVAALLEDMCTIREIDEMAQRLYVAKLLENDHSYLDISELTGASATTIARVSKALHYGAGGYRSVLDNEAAFEAAGEKTHGNPHATPATPEPPTAASEQA